MKPRLLLMALLAGLAGCVPDPSIVGEAVVLETADGVTVYGDVYTVDGDKSAPLVLLFHQGGSNTRAEYERILPRLLDRRLNVLAIDQRRGGNRLGGRNRTVDSLHTADSLGTATYGYCDAYPDLEAALAYARAAGYTGPRLAWGSSYSATLTLRLAAEHPDAIQGVLAFSPAAGEPMDGCQPDDYLPGVRVPLLVLRPGREMEIEAVQRQMEVLDAAGHQTYVAERGVHGSSMLDSTRTESPTDATWAVVLGFLDDVLAGS